MERQFLPKFLLEFLPASMTGCTGSKDTPGNAAGMIAITMRSTAPDESAHKQPISETRTSDTWSDAAQQELESLERMENIGRLARQLGSESPTETDKLPMQIFPNNADQSEPTR